MLIIRIGAVHVTQEYDVIRITIPIVHSSTTLTADETDELAKALRRAIRNIRKGKYSE